MVADCGSGHREVCGVLLGHPDLVTIDVMRQNNVDGTDVRVTVEACRCIMCIKLINSPGYENLAGRSLK